MVLVAEDSVEGRLNGRRFSILLNEIKMALIVIVMAIIIIIGFRL
jgi:hypothetical protein